MARSTEAVTPAGPQPAAPARKRIRYLDALKGIGILMIMYGHITGLGNPVDTWMSSFKVPLFYLVSGMLMCYTGSLGRANFPGYVRKTFRSVMMPYIWFGVLGLLFKTGCVWLKHKPAEVVEDAFRTYLYDLLFMKGLNSLWFLPTLFVGMIVFYVVYKCPKLVQAVYAVAGLFSIHLACWLTELCDSRLGEGILYEALTRLISATGKGFMAAWFIEIGFYIFLLYRKLESRPIKFAGGILLTAVNVYLSQINQHVDINMLSEGEIPALFYVTSIVGTMGLLMLLDALSDSFEFNGLNWLGVNSLTIMATHTVFGFRKLCYDGWKSVAHIPETTPAGLEYVVECFVVLALLVLIEYGVVELVNRKFPFMTGGRNRKPAVSKA